MSTRADSSGVSAGASQPRSRRRPGDAKLARNIAAAQATVASRNGGLRRGRRAHSTVATSASGSRLRFLLCILLVTTLLLVLLQAVRHVRSRSGNLHVRLARVRAALEAQPGSAQQHRMPRSWSDRLANAASAAFIEVQPASVASASAVAAERERRAEDRQTPLGWSKYIAAMRQHFDEELLKARATANPSHEQDKAMRSQGTDASAGMVVVPGEGVRDHMVSLGEGKQPASIPGKSQEEAHEDRQVALEDLDQETLKAMFDALYDRG